MAATALNSSSVRRIWANRARSSWVSAGLGGCSPPAHLVQHLLGRVGRLLECGQLEDPGVSLERVNDPEQLVDDVGGHGAALRGSEQRLPHGHQELALTQKRVEQVGVQGRDLGRSLQVALVLPVLELHLRLQPLQLGHVLGDHHHPVDAAVLVDRSVFEVEQPLFDGSVGHGALVEDLREAVGFGQHPLQLIGAEDVAEPELHARALLAIGDQRELEQVGQAPAGDGDVAEDLTRMGRHFLANDAVSADGEHGLLHVVQDVGDLFLALGHLAGALLHLLFEPDLVVPEVSHDAVEGAGQDAHLVGPLHRDRLEHGGAFGA